MPSTKIETGSALATCMTAIDPKASFAFSESGYSDVIKQTFVTLAIRHAIVDADSSELLVHTSWNLRVSSGR
jgi:hypothetical protein